MAQEHCEDKGSHYGCNEEEVFVPKCLEYAGNGNSLSDLKGL